jgi:hypothetical protein
VLPTRVVLTSRFPPEACLQSSCPVFNEEESGCRAAPADLAPRSRASTHEVVYVDDGSTRRLRDALIEALGSERDVVLVKLSRNFGMEVAMSAGSTTRAATTSRSCTPTCRTRPS